MQHDQSQGGRSSGSSLISLKSKMQQLVQELEKSREEINQCHSKIEDEQRKAGLVCHSRVVSLTFISARFEHASRLL